MATTKTYLFINTENAEQFANAAEACGVQYQTNEYKDGDEAFIARMDAEDFDKLSSEYPYLDLIPASREEVEMGDIDNVDEINWV